jgi:hypothetical protein
VLLEEEILVRVYALLLLELIQTCPILKGPFGPLTFVVAGADVEIKGTIPAFGAVPVETVYALTAEGLTDIEITPIGLISQPIN